MKKFLRNLLFPKLLTSIFSGYGKIMVKIMVAVPIIFKTLFASTFNAPKMVAVPIIKKNAKVGILLVGAMVAGSDNKCLGEEILGKLKVGNYIADINIGYGNHNTTHFSEGKEGYNSSDRIYSTLFPPSGKMTKIISRIPGYELRVDTRPIDSLTPIDVELAIHTQWGGSLTFSNIKNELWCSLPLAKTPPYFADFGNKPLTLWEKSIIDPNENPNDPNNYTISLITDIREAIDKSDFIGGDGIKYALVPRPDLNGTYASQVPYDYLQTRFDVFPGDFDFDGEVNLKDYAYWANCDPIADITGEQGLPDGIVDLQDFVLYLRDYLKDSNDPNTWSRLR